MPLRLLLLVVVLCSQVHALAVRAPRHHGTAPTVRCHASPRARGIVLAEKEDGAGSFSDAFANLAKKAKPQKPGEGAPKRTDVKGLPIRLGGNVRDGSLGSFRAAGKNLDVLKDPRNWETEEFGLLGVIVFTVAAFSYGYIEYVADKPDIAPAPGQAAIVRQQKVAACAGDTKCIQAAVDSTQEAMEKEGALKGCLGYAFGRTEKQMCEDKYGAKGGFKLF